MIFMERLKQKKTWAVAGCIVLFVAMVIGFVRLVQGPSLGSKFSYIGAHNSSCDWVGAVISIGFCRPQEEYFFETDMSIDDLKAHFKEFKASEEYSASDLAYSGAELIFEGPVQEFTIFYYNSPENVVKKYNLRSSQKKHVIGIRDFYLSEAQRSLK